MANTKHNLLTATKVRTLTTPGTYTDGDTLTLRVSKTLNKRWVQRITIYGRQRNIGLGAYPAVGLAEARTKAQENARAIRQGRDPIKEKRSARERLEEQDCIPAFREAAAAVIEIYRPTWKSDKTAKQWDGSLNKHVFPAMGDKRISEITTAHVTSILEPIWTKHEDVSRKLFQRMAIIFRHAISKGWRTDNPADERATNGLPKRRRRRNHFPALPYEEVPAALATIRDSDADLNTKLAFEFMVLTAARSGEVRRAQWDEIDLEKRVRTVPDSLMKMDKEHKIPLSDRAVEILEQARTLTNGELVFPTKRSIQKDDPRPFSDMAFSMLMKRLGFAAVPHGFRSSFKDWTRERQQGSDIPSELALAHFPEDKVKGAYARSDLLETRRRLMQNWDHFLRTGESLPFEWVASEVTEAPWTDTPRLSTVR